MQVWYASNRASKRSPDNYTLHKHPQTQECSLVTRGSSTRTGDGVGNVYMLQSTKVWGGSSVGVKAEVWWTIWDSNPGPLGCEPNALTD